MPFGLHTYAVENADEVVVCHARFDFTAFLIRFPFKDVTDDGKLVVGDVFLETTLNNLKVNDGKIAVSVYDAQSLEGYQIKGTAEYVTEGTIVDTFKAMVEKMFNGAATAKGALVITPSKVIVTTPGAENKKEI